MKRFKKVLLTLGLTGMVGLSSAFLISCRKEEQVSVSFNTNGATEISDVSVNAGEKVVLPVPTRDGYRFDGWYANENFEGEAITEATVSGNVTYYAKWTQVFAINLDLNGGELSTTTVYVPHGANIYEAVKDLTPTKAGLAFGAWFNGNNELSTTTTMKSESLTLKAQYKVAYSVEIYLQNLDNDEYTKAETLTGSEYVGKNFTSSQRKTGFSEVSDEATLTKKLSETASENVFKHYFDRNTYTITFNPNYPNAAASDTTSVTAKYGQKIEIPSDLSKYNFEGYCLLGWTTSSTDNAIEYPADLNKLLYNPEEGEAAKQEYLVERTATLYGVWQKGYTDMFGGNDYIYYMSEEKAVYLCRGNVYFKGEFNAKNNEFYFDNEKDEEVLSGKLYSTGKYVYYSEKRSKTSILYQSGVGPVETEKIRFDTYNGITYTVYDESGKTIEESKGTYEISESGDYIATFTSGAMSGKKLSFIVGSITNAEGGTESAFQVRNEDEYQIGKIILTGILKSEAGVYDIGYASSVYFELDGFGTATYTSGGRKTTYKYSINEDGNIALTDANDNPMGTICLVDIPESKEDAKGYMIYTEAMDDTFVLGANETLTLDGLYNAVYEKNGKKIESYYISTTSPMGGTIVSIIDKTDKTEYKFLLTPKTETVEDESQGTVTVETFTAKKVLNTYAEYYYKDGKSIYYAPMLVIDETEAGKASVYGYTSEKSYVKALEGTYVLGDDGLYVFTVTKTFDASEAYSDPIDLTTIESFIFALDTETTGYSVNYWYSSNNGETNYYVDYENTDITSSATLKLVGGFAFYKESATAKAVIGAYTQEETLLTITVSEDKYYFSIDEENKKFTVLQYAPYSAYLKNSDNTYNQKIYLAFDGLGGAVYTVLSETEGDAPTEISGTISIVKENNLDKETLFEEKIYKFTPNDAAQADKAFEFICVTIGARAYFALSNADFAADSYFAAANSQMDGKLTIDGYCYWAKFVTNEQSYSGMYYIDENAIVLNAGKVFYFDFNSNGEFTVRGQEHGVYALYENQYTNGLFVELDGYGKLSVFTLVLKAGTTDKYERSYISENGEYTIEDDIYTFVYGTGEEAKAYTCILNSKSVTALDGNKYKGFTISKDFAKNVFVDTSDWSVLILDKFGRATKYDKEGQKQAGNYTLITDSLLYFINSAATDACIYSYNTESGEATPVKLEAKSYYTEDLKSLYFSKYGFAIFNGNEDDLYFYNYEGDNVIIYRRAQDGEEANAYGFVKDNFGLLEETKTYNDEVYYRNYGTDIMFARSEAETKKYPLILDETTVYYLTDLQFSPSGGAEFSVIGKASFIIEKTKENGNVETTNTDMNCTVTRTLVDGEPEMYVTVGGSYRYYITASYTGAEKGNPYEVESLRYVQSFPSYRYLDVLFRIYYMYGAASANAYANEFGTVTIEIDYNQDGTEAKSSLKAELGEASELYDMEGNLISFNESKFSFLDNGLNVAEFEAQDGYTYRLYFAVSQYPYLNAYGYYVYALVRLQEIEVDDYVLTVGRTIATEAQGIVVGDVYSLGISKNGTVISGDEFFQENGKLVYVARTRDAEGYVTAATYYTIELVENESGSVEDEEIVETYKSATITSAEATILCEKDPEDPNETYKGKDRYVEIVNGEVKVLYLVGNKRYAKTSTYDAATGIYTVETTEGWFYYVKVVGDNVVIADDVSELND